LGGESKGELFTKVKLLTTRAWGVLCTCLAALEGLQPSYRVSDSSTDVVKKKKKEERKRYVLRKWRSGESGANVQKGINVAGTEGHVTYKLL